MALDEYRNLKKVAVLGNPALSKVLDRQQMLLEHINEIDEKLAEKA
jgi:hypothetical protein